MYSNVCFREGNLIRLLGIPSQAPLIRSWNFSMACISWRARRCSKIWQRNMASSWYLYTSNELVSACFRNQWVGNNGIIGIWNTYLTNQLKFFNTNGTWFVFFFHGRQLPELRGVTTAPRLYRTTTKPRLNAEKKKSSVQFCSTSVQFCTKRIYTQWALQYAILYRAGGSKKGAAIGESPAAFLQTVHQPTWRTMDNSHNRPNTSNMLGFAKSLWSAKKSCT